MTPRTKDTQPARDGQAIRTTFHTFVQAQVRRAIRAND